MIFVDRGSVPEPEVYLSEKTVLERERVVAEARALRSSVFPSAIAQKAQEGVLKARNVLRSDYTSRIWREARQTLLKLFQNKCAYCESSLQADYGDIELYRPRGNARNLDGSVDPLHYFWLALDWENTLIACTKCNRGKGSRFPIAAGRAEFGESGREALAAEQPYLLNPCDEQPGAHLAVFSSGVLLPLSERGKYTIEVLNLNRKELIEERGRQWNMTQIRCEHLQRNHVLGKRSEAVNEALGDILRREAVYAFAIQHSAFAYLMENQPDLLLEREIRKLFPDVSSPSASGRPTFVSGPSPDEQPRDELPREFDFGSKIVPSTSAEIEKTASEIYQHERARQQSYSVEAEDEGARIAYFTSAKRIERFTVRNFKAIAELQLTFPTPETERESWLMLLGENGCGKSSILQALALTLMGQEHANSLGLDARRFVRRDADSSSGEVIVEISGVGPIRLEFTASSEFFRVDPPDPKVLLLGYGATRLLPKAVGREASTRKAIRILNLFDPTAPLADTESWLLDRSRVNDDQFESFREDVTRLLMLPEDTRIYRDNGQIEMEYFGWRKALRDMSDGFQSIVALAGDISIGVNDWWGSLREAEGIVLLDEIEVHLHPRWKISIVERLRQTCPHLSFIVTTHDPLCLKGLRSEELVVLRRTAEREVELVTDIPRIDHLRSDQLLSSFLFNLPSTRGSGTAAAVARYSQLLGRESRTPVEESELAELRTRLEQELSSSVTPVQQSVEKAVYAALTPEAIGEGSVASLEVLRQVRDLLSTEET